MKSMTIRITFELTDGTCKKILFGNSYKHWREQAVEFIFNNYKDRRRGWRYDDLAKNGLKIISVEQSDDQWIGWGGLKWCEESIFQQALNREGVQKNEPDNPNPRQYDRFVFWPYEYGFKSLVRELKKW